MSILRSPRLLQLVPYQHPALRQVTEKVSFPLSEVDRALIEDMKYSIQREQLKAANAPWEAAVGMAANQWGITKCIFLYCPDGDSVSNLEVIINPSYEALPEPDVDANADPLMQNEMWEGCFSVPLALGNIRRFSHIKVTYNNEAGVRIERELSGWPARVWQHENDHLNGILYDNPHTGRCLEKKCFTSLEEAMHFRYPEKA